MEHESNTKHRVLSIHSWKQKFSMNVKMILSIAVFVLAVIFGIEGSCDTQPAREKAITVNYPPDKTVMEFDLLSMSLKVPKGSADLIKVNVNQDEKIKIIPDNEFECFSIQLSVGNNMIHIVAIREGRIVDEIFINVFRRSDLESIYYKPPAGFKKESFHAGERKECAGCHTLVPAASDRKPVSISAFPAEKLKGSYDAAAAVSTCYSCHKTLLSHPFVHAPAAVWSCLTCHKPQPGQGYTVSKPDTRACFSCHLDKKEKWYPKKYLHGPFNTGKCAICHDPHASENPFNLIKDTWDLCVSCHIDKGSGRHIVRNFSVGYYHPTRGKPDPSRPGRELSCSSCHNPHASDMSNLIRINYSSLYELCKKCHAK